MRYGFKQSQKCKMLVCFGSAKEQKTYLYGNRTPRVGPILTLVSANPHAFMKSNKIEIVHTEITI